MFTGLQYLFIRNTDYLDSCALLSFVTNANGSLCLRMVAKHFAPLYQPPATGHVISAPARYDSIHEQLKHIVATLTLVVWSHAAKTT
jgi:hypothetical protein